MPGPPEEFTVEQLVSSSEIWGDNNDRRTDEVLFENDGRTWKIYNVASSDAPAAGSVLKGWKNHDKGTFGLAKDRPPGGRTSPQTGMSSNGRRDDATGQSIERQVAAKAAAEMAVAAGGDAPTLIANFEAYFDIVAGKIAGTPLVTTDAS